MAEYNYDQVRAIVQGNGGLNPPPNPNAPAPGTAVQGTFTGTVEIDIGKYQDLVAELKFEEESDQTFDATVTTTSADPSVEKLMGVDEQGKHTYLPKGAGGSIFLNSKRVVINSNEDFTMMFGERGVAIGSPERVNIDAGKSVTLFGHESVFLGIPNRGEEFTEDPNAPRSAGDSVGHPTPDEVYEPMVLGIKLANLIEDLIVTLEQGEIASALGNGLWQPSTLAEFELIKVRIPEILSSYAYVDGMTHSQIDEDRLNTVLEAREAAEDYVPPRTLTGTVTGTFNGVTGGAPPVPQNPVTSPFAELPGFFETPGNPPYGDEL